jgi:hypothetical protein
VCALPAAANGRPGPRLRSDGQAHEFAVPIELHSIATRLTVTELPRGSVLLWRIRQSDDTAGKVDELMDLLATKDALHSSYLARCHEAWLAVDMSRRVVCRPSSPPRK